MQPNSAVQFANKSLSTLTFTVETSYSNYKLCCSLLHFNGTFEQQIFHFQNVSKLVVYDVMFNIESLYGTTDPLRLE